LEAKVISIIDEQGIERFLGNNPAPVRYTWRTYGDVPQTPMVPRSRWKELIAALPPGPDAWYLPPTHDQDGAGMCNCSATAGALEASRGKQGLPYVSLSGGDLYHRICGGSDRGSMLEDGLRESMAVGIASTTVVPYMDWQRSHPEAAPDRARFRVLEAFLCPTFDHCFSAALEGFDLISGVMWYNNYKVDSEGWLPRQGRGGGGGHAVHGYKPAVRGDTFGIWHQNSWTSQWGLQGRCVFPEDMYEGPVGGWWAVRSVTTEPDDTPAPRS
jgi:hypothetical protein